MATQKSAWILIPIGLVFYVCIFEMIEAVGAIESHELQIYNSLFVNSGYQKNIRPVEDSTMAVEVHLEFDLLKIQVDEVSQVITLVGFMLCEWEDYHLRWNASDFGNVSKLVVPASNIWLPDFAIVNSAGSFYNGDFRDEFRVKLNADGKVIWDFGGTFRVSCDLQLDYYPFDKQVCWLEAENWVYDKTEVHLRNATTVILTDSYQPNGMWDIFATRSHYRDVTFNSLPGLVFPQVRFEFFMERKLKYYGMNIIGPGILLALLALLSMWLPADSGEKIGLGITIILSFSVYQLLIDSSTPRTSAYIPLITVWMFALMAISTIDTSVAILVLYMNHHLPTRPPKLLRAMMFGCVAKALCMKSTIPDSAIKQNQVEAEDSNDSINKEHLEDVETKLLLNKEPKDKLQQQVAEVIAHLKEITDGLKAKAAEDTNIGEWQALGRITDRLFFIITLIGIIVATISSFSGRNTFEELLLRAEVTT